jgi:HEAT repeat protein
VLIVPRSRLTDPDREVRVEAVRALITLVGYGDDEAREMLREMVTHYRDFDAEILGWAVTCVGEFGDEELSGPLLAALTDRDHGSEYWAAVACGRLGIRAAEPLLIPLLDHPLGWLRGDVCRALGEIGATTAVHTLVACLDDPEEYVRQTAAEALTELRTAEAVEGLFSALHARRHRRLHYLAEALARCGPDTHDRLLDATACEDPEIRFWAARALGQARALGTIEDARVEQVLTLLTDDHATTPTGAKVSTAARRALKPPRRRREDSHVPDLS